MRVQAPHPGQQHHGISLGAPKGRAPPCVTTCSAQPAWPAPSPERGPQRRCLSPGCRPARCPPPAPATGPAVDRQQLTCTSFFLWADAHSSGTLHSHSFKPGRSALLLSPFFRGENCCKETLSGLSRITGLVGEPGRLALNSRPLQPQYTALRGPFPSSSRTWWPRLCERMNDWLPYPHTVHSSLADPIAASSLHVGKTSPPVLLYDFCPKVGFSVLVSFPDPDFVTLFLPPLYNPSLFTCVPSPLPDLYLEFQQLFSLAVEQLSVRNWPIKKPYSAPPLAPQVVSSLWGRHCEQGQECAQVKGLVGREGLCLERLGVRRKGFKARQSWGHRGQPSTPVSPSLPVLNF